MKISKKQQQKQLMDWRRSQILVLRAQGHFQEDIARILQVDRSTVSRDIVYLDQKSKENIRKHVESRLPIELDKCLAGLTAILRESWDIAHEQNIERRENIQALALAKEVYHTKLELLTSANVLKDAMKFVESHLKDNNTAAAIAAADNIKKAKNSITTIKVESSEVIEEESDDNVNDNEDKGDHEFKEEIDQQSDEPVDKVF
jgi:IS30 family transposase